MSPPQDRRTNVVSVKFADGAFAAFKARCEAEAPGVPLSTHAHSILTGAASQAARPAAVDPAFVLKVVMFIVTQVRPELDGDELRADLAAYFSPADDRDGGAP